MRRTTTSGYCSSAWGQHPVALTAFYKNQQKTPKTKIETALDRQKIWKRAFGDTPPI